MVAALHQHPLQVRMDVGGPRRPLGLHGDLALPVHGLMGDRGVESQPIDKILSGGHARHAGLMARGSMDRDVPDRLSC